ncbi:ABC transporter transmembrane domain-containing protein [Flexivirga oryzae]|uniref:Putative ABC transport system ATP-binding protein n=1 Tax=Flexivirga oryzae TaxID=1794944 RepID=A0A839N7N3_9MICO|nr:ABC transporter ATP-binding protein [Flexivirga oryzae]MBB2890751.1 putative ABC transport system ATP-binding protein [Flexivirga oryzae]
MSLTSLGLLRRSLHRHRGRLAASTALLTVWQACETSVPVFIGLVVDHAVVTGEFDALVWWLAGFGALFLCLSLCYRFGSRLGFAVGQDEMHQLRLEITHRVLSDRGVRTDLSAGEVLSLATSDTERVGAGARVIATGVAALGAVVLACVLLLRIDVLLGVVTVVGSVVVLLAIRALSPRISAHSGAQQETIARASGMATDFVRGLRPLKGIGGEAVALATYRSASRAAQDSGIRTARSLGELRGASTALSGVYLAVVAGLSGALAAHGDITLGDLIAVVGIAQFLAEPLGSLGAISATAASAHASAGRIARFLQAPPLTADGPMGLGGSSQDAPALRIGPATGDEVCVEPGSFAAFVIPEPVVADGLLSSLGGDDETWTVALDGTPLGDVRLPEVRRRLLVAPHHAAVFAGSIRSNIGAPDGTTDAALAASAADELVDLFEEGLDHPTDSGGGALSGGQRQRIALARALAADRPLLILQDPTTAVDAVTEQRIANGIRQFRHGDSSRRATVVITSSPALLATADRVFFFATDTVVAGTHADLLARDDYQQAVIR